MGSRTHLRLPLQQLQHLPLLVKKTHRTIVRGWISLSPQLLLHTAMPEYLEQHIHEAVARSVRVEPTPGPVQYSISGTILFKDRYHTQSRTGKVPIYLQRQLLLLLAADVFSSFRGDLCHAQHIEKSHTVVLCTIHHLQSLVRKTWPRSARRI
jgi:hypothetical protein